MRIEIGSLQILIRMISLAITITGNLKRKIKKKILQKV